MTPKEIKALSPVERIAGYLLVECKLIAILARLRKNGRSDETWTIEEEAEWEDACDQVDPWAYALSEEELEAIKPITCYLSSIGRGEWPLNLIA